MLKISLGVLNKFVNHLPIALIQEASCVSLQFAERIVQFLAPLVEEADIFWVLKGAVGFELDFNKGAILGEIH